MNPVFLLVFVLISCNVIKEDKNVDEKEKIKEGMNSDTNSMVSFDSIKLSEKTSTQTFSFAAIECSCPQWFESKFREVEYLEGIEKFYLEPQHAGIVNANDFWDGRSLPLTVRVTGKFSIHKELPKGYSSKSIPEKARIFVYSSIEIIEPRNSN